MITGGQGWIDSRPSHNITLVAKIKYGSLTKDLIFSDDKKRIKVHTKQFQKQPKSKESKNQSTESKKEKVGEIII